MSSVVIANYCFTSSSAMNKTEGGSRCGKIFTMTISCSLFGHNGSALNMLLRGFLTLLGISANKVNVQS